MFRKEKNKLMHAKVYFFALLLGFAAQSSGFKIHVTGNQRIETQTILDYIPLDVKESKGHEDDVIKALIATGFFNDVRVSMTQESLNIDVEERPSIQSVTFEGNKEVKKEMIEKIVKISPREFLSTHRVREVIEVIRQAYASLSFYRAQVSSKIIRRDDNAVDLIFVVDEGPRAHMKIFFLGNKSFSAKQLKKVISSKERPWYAFIPMLRAMEQNYSAERVQEDRRHLQEFYQNNGYLDAKITLAQGELVPLKKYFAVSFSIQEGKRYRMGDTTFDMQAKDVDVGFMQDAVPWKKGQRVNQKSVENFCEQLPWVIQRHLKDDRVSSFQCMPEMTKKEDGTVDIKIVVMQLPTSFAGKISFEGNHLTKEHVIRREMQFSEGDSVDLFKIKASENNLKALGLLDSVDISSLPGDTPQVEDFIVHLKDKEDVRTIQGSAGYSDFDGFTGRIEYTDANFKGEGKTVNVSGIASQRNQSLSCFYSVPYFMEREISANFGADLIRQRGDTTGNFKEKGSYVEMSGGANTGVRYNLTSNIDQSWDYSIRYADLNARKGSHMNYYAAENIAERKRAILSTIRHEITYSTIFPKLGFSRGILGLSTAFTGLGGNTCFLSDSAYFNLYVPLRHQFQLRFETSYRWKNPWGFMRFNDQIDISGYSFPGFDVGGIGPRDPETGEALFGKQGYFAAMKLDFPIPTPVEMPISGIAFVQSGAVWNSIFKNPRIATLPILSQGFFNRVSMGIGIQGSFPMIGQIGLVFSRVLRKHPADLTKKFEIIVGRKI